MWWSPIEQMLMWIFSKNRFSLAVCGNSFILCCIWTVIMGQGPVDYVDKDQWPRCLRKVQGHLAFCINFPINCRVQNVAAHILACTKVYDHITLVLKSLLWLLVEACQVKIAADDLQSCKLHISSEYIYSATQVCSGALLRLKDKGLLTISASDWTNLE